MKVDFALKTALFLLVSVHFILVLLQFLKKKKLINSISNRFIEHEKKLLKKTTIVSFIFYLLFLSSIVFYIFSPKTFDYSLFIPVKKPHIVFAFDVSKTMKTEDVLPGRIEKAKEISQNILKELKGNILVEIDTISSKDYVISPKTQDRDFLKKAIFKVKPKEVNDIKGFVKYINDIACNENEFTSIIIFTDGEIFAKNETNFEKARKCGLKFFIVGIGKMEPSPIPVRNEFGELMGWEKDISGENILSELNMFGILKLAGRGQNFVIISNDNYKKKKLKAFIREIKKSTFKKNIAIKKDFSNYFLLISLVFFMSWLILG